MKTPLAGFPVGAFAAGGAMSDRGISTSVGAGGGVGAGVGSPSASGVAAEPPGAFASLAGLTGIRTCQRGT
jgi:hypothetical protein